MEELEPTIQFAKQTERETLQRCLAALYATLLIVAEGVDAAWDHWTGAGLPVEVPAVVDLDNQSWREMEAVACAWLRLLMARPEFDAAREAAAALLAVCAERGLTRARMRGLALAMVVEHRAGVPAAARAHLIDYLEMFADTDYARPLVLKREVSLAVLNSIDASGMGKRQRHVIAALKSILQDEPRQPNTADVPTLTEREQEVLQRLERWRDKEIGAAFGLSEDGVRYHVKNIFKKLGVSNRFDATRRARVLELLPEPGDDEA